MAYKRRTWKEKLEDDKGFPKFIRYSPKLPCGKSLKKLGARSGDRVVLAPAQEVIAVMQRVPEGRLITLGGICQYLARRYKADYCCPLTTGIFVMTVANAAEETGSPVPYWRTIKNSGELNDKFPGGSVRHKSLLEKEGFSVAKRRGKFVIEDFEEYLYHPTS